jgi:hypothetical protein
MSAKYCWLLVLVTGPALAHHSTLGFFDRDQVVEIEGELLSLSMVNPHVRFVVEVTDTSGNKVPWDIETSAVSVLRTRGLDQDFMEVGDHIRVSGNPSRRGRPEMSGLTVLLENGTEVVTALRGSPYFTNPDDGNLLAPAFDPAAEEEARRSANGIFRVWSTVLEDPASFPMFKGQYPLTAQAQRERDAWNVQDEEQLRCWEKGMPLLMITPVPIEFVQTGDDIVIRFEEDDAERLIHMTGNIDAAGVAPSLLGYSTGRWEGRTLVVETSRIDFPYLDDRGAPQSPDVHLLERFTLSESEDRLDYRVTVTDPATFSAPFDLTRYWTWRPEVTVGRWDCQQAE